MWYFLLKTIVSALIVAGVSEIAKRLTPLAALIASLPLTTILAFSWIYIDTRNPGTITAMSHDMLWLILPSAAFFLILPLLLKHGWSFPLSMVVSTVATVALSSVVAYLIARK